MYAHTLKREQLKKLMDFFNRFPTNIFGTACIIWGPDDLTTATTTTTNINVHFSCIFDGETNVFIHFSRANLHTYGVWVA